MAARSGDAARQRRKHEEKERVDMRRSVLVAENAITAPVAGVSTVEIRRNVFFTKLTTIEQLYAEELEALRNKHAARVRTLCKYSDWSENLIVTSQRGWTTVARP